MAFILLTLAFPASASHLAGAAQITLTPNCGPPGPGLPVTLELNPERDSNPVGEAHRVTATVRDAEGNPVPDGTQVDFHATRPPGIVVPDGGSTEQTPSVSGSATTVGGEATFEFTSIKPGTSDITATAGTAGDVATKIWVPGPPARVFVRPTTDTNAEGDPHTVTASVFDQYGNDVADGTQVNFVVTGTGFESPKNGSNATMFGEATFTFTSSINGSGGTSTVTATAGSAFGTARKTWTDVFVGPRSIPSAVSRQRFGPRAHSSLYITRVSHAAPAITRSLLPSPAPPGKYEFTVSGGGFLPGRVVVIFDRDGIREQFSTLVDASGKFSLVITPVQRPVGAYVVEASDENNTHVDTALFFAPCPTLEVRPTLGRAGQTALAIGVGFLKNSQVDLEWEPGVGRRRVGADSIGFFQMRVLVLPGDTEGPRVLRAVTPGTPEFPRPEDDYLVVPGSIQPGDFVVRR